MADAGSDVVGQPVQVGLAKTGKDLSQATQVSALLVKNMRIHCRVNVCPCLSCCGPGRCIPFVIFNPAFMHFFCPIFFVIGITILPYMIVQGTLDNPADFLEVKFEKGSVVKSWPGIPVGEMAGALHDEPNVFLSQPYNLDIPVSSWQRAGNAGLLSGGPGSMALPAAHHLFAPRSKAVYSWETRGCNNYPVSCHCQTLAIVGPDAAADAFKAYLEAEYATFNTTVLPKETELVVNRRGQGAPAFARRLRETRSEVYRFLAEAPPTDVLAEAPGFFADVARRLAVAPAAPNLTFNDYDDQDTSNLGRRGRESFCQSNSLVVEEKYCDVNPGHNGPIFRKFASAADVDKWINSDHYGWYHKDRSATSDIDRLCGAVIFENDVRTEAKPKYTLRFNVTDPSGTGSSVSSSLTARSIELGKQDDDEVVWYFQSGFLALQNFVQKFVGQERSAPASSKVNADPILIPAPTQGYQVWGFGEIAGEFLNNPFTIALMFGPIPSSIAFYISRERQSRLREQMRMMGLGDTALTWAWVLMFVGFNFFITFVMNCFFTSYLLRNTDFFLFWMALWWFANALVPVGMVVAAIITSDRLAAMGAFGFLFGSSFLVEAIGLYDSMAKKALMSLVPTLAFFQTVRTAWEWEKLGIGMTATTVNTDLNNFNGGVGIFMLFLDFWLWLALYYYLDNVATWHDVGVGRSLCFCLTGSYWREIMGKAPKIEALTELESDAGAKGEYVETEEDAHLKNMVANNQCVLIRGLHKSFRDAAGKPINAVSNLSLTMYQDECFCLLGHNGAGKTTTMMMLTGCLPQTLGTIKVRGCQVPEQLRTVRSDMGFCPQHNVLIDELTVFEHLMLFGKIGNMSKEALVKRGEQLLSAVALMDKMHARSSALSGGMKRKLSCALAFLSNPYLVILDEPSSGMDPFARRGMWDTLKQWRSGHILCLTTHYMDEADALGDRIAIMSDGQLACSGSSDFLKRAFGCGYVLAFAKKQGPPEQDSEILRMVQGCVGKEAEMVSSIGKELLVQVPFNAADRFPALFSTIDKDLEKLGIESYGTSVTNLEEVFMRVAKISREKRQSSKEEIDLAAEVTIQVDAKEEGPSPVKFFMIQLGALMIRRFRHAYRNRLTCCCQVGMPVGCVCSFFLLIAAFSVNALPALILDTTAWNPEIARGPQVPLTVGAIQGDTQMDAMMTFWATMPGTSGVRLERVPSSAALGPIAGGLKEEGAFMKLVLENQDIHEASQFGSIFYPDTSSWCPASYDACGAPGPTIVCNTTAPHAGPILFGMHANAALQGPGFDGFELTNHPFQKTRQQREAEEFISGIFASIIIMAAYGFVPSGATSYIVMEKERDVKHQLIISGCNQTTYWLSNFFFDILWGFIPVCGAWLAFFAFDIDSYIVYPGINASVALFMAFLPAMAGFAYIFSFAFSKAGVALFVSWIFNLSAGFIGVMLVFTLGFFEDLQGASSAMAKIFRFIPVYDLGYGHLRVSVFSRNADVYDYGPLSGITAGGAYCPEDMRGQPPERACQYLAGDEFLMLMVCAFFWITLVIIFDVVYGMPAVRKALGFSGKSPAWLQNWKADAEGEEDDLVLAEKERVKTLNGKEQFVYVNGIHKIYGSGGRTHAVRGISFAADEGQVFGLLGVNGAGKTTTFKILCGQVEPTAGEVRIQGYDVSVHAAEARKYIGYCPQFDALLESLTPREHLYLYGRLKGLYGDRVSAAVRSQLTAMDLDSYTQSRAGQLSGGNKRKLSVAMATIGEPPMVFLDEPSAGMDPVARRGMWTVIQNIADKRKKSVVILTTHSMDEAEALCSRIAIQVDGQFRCLGTAQQIKSRYGEGLELNVRLQTPSQEEIAACCTLLGGAPTQTMDCNFARQKVEEVYGERIMSDLLSRVGSPLNGVTTGMAVLSEWLLLVQRVQDFEAFLYTELVKDAPDPSAPMCVVLEKTQNVARYQITPAALQGRFKSLGTLFNVFQENTKKLLLSDFHICQTSLEQIFNRFATMQMSQVQNARPGPTQVAPSPATPTEASPSAEAKVIGKGAEESSGPSTSTPL